MRTIPIVSGCSRLTAARTSSPSASFIERSVRTRSNGSLAIRAIASRPPEAISTAYPFFWRMTDSESRTFSSSSTTRMRDPRWTDGTMLAIG